MSSPLPSSDSNAPFFNDRFVNSFKANAALAPGQVVKIVGSSLVDTVSATTELVLGVTWDSAIAGRSINVITRGIVRAASDNAVTAGDLLTGGVSGVFHDIGASTIASPGSGVAFGFPRAIALETQATIGSTFLAALF